MLFCMNMNYSMANACLSLFRNYWKFYPNPKSNSSNHFLEIYLFYVWVLYLHVCPSQKWHKISLQMIVVTGI